MASTAHVRRAMTRLRGLFALVLLSADDPQTSSSPFATARRSSWASATASTSSRRTCAGHPAATPATWCSWKTKKWRSSRRPARVVLGFQWHGRHTQDAHTRHLGSHFRGEGRLQALHAQGDLRAAARPCATPCWAAPRSKPGTHLILGDGHLGRTTCASIDRVITLLACGTSWHAALVGKFLIEELAQDPVEVDYGSEYRYRKPDRRQRRRSRSPSRSLAKPPTRWRRYARPSSKGAKQPRHLQRRWQHGHAREAEGTISHPRRPGNRRRLDQGLHDSQLVALYLFALRLG